MPAFERSRPPSGPVVSAFTSEGYAVEGAVHAAVLLTPERALAWDPPALEDLDAGDLAPLLELDPPPEFVILGTGAAMRFAPRRLVDALESRGVGVEAMDSRAAARTWSLLRGEQRWIAAALMAL